jgi:hypothetical protein
MLESKHPKGKPETRFGGRITGMAMVWILNYADAGDIFTAKSQRSQSGRNAKPVS